MARVSVKQKGRSAVFDFYFEGKRRRPTLPLDMNNKSQKETAYQKMNTIQLELAMGIFDIHKHFPQYQAAKKYRKGNQITIKEKLESWLKESYRNHSHTTYMLYYSSVYHHLIPEFGELSLTQLSSEMVKEWLYTLHQKPNTVNNILIPLKAIYKEADQEGLIDRNPLTLIKNKKKEPPEPDPLTMDEINALLDNATGQEKNYFKFAIWSGLRTGEQIALTWEKVNHAKGTAFIKNTRTAGRDKPTPKTRSSIRHIELNKYALEALEAQKKYTSEGHIFKNPHTNKPWHDSKAVRAAWRRLVEKSGVRYRKPYCTRHTYASIALTSHVNPSWLSKQMGHSSLRMTLDVYATWIESDNVTENNKIVSFVSSNGHQELVNA